MFRRRAAGSWTSHGLTSRGFRVFFRFPLITDGRKPAMHAYRTDTCGALRISDAGRAVRLSGWVHRKRDHGQLLFIDLRDHYGITQCVIDSSSRLFEIADAQRLESVLTVKGTVVKRSSETVNPK